MARFLGVEKTIPKSGAANLLMGSEGLKFLESIACRARRLVSMTAMAFCATSQSRS